MKEKRNNLVGGLILVSIGLLALAGQFFEFTGIGNLAIYFMAGLGAIFLLWGIVSREAGLIIPGGIISGIGWGIVLVTGSAPAGADEGGLFLLAFAAGWVAITLLTAIFTEETHWWALIPGGIIGLTGLGVMYGGMFMSLLELLGKIWPVFLIILGVAVLFGARRSSEKEPKAIEQ